ncbi:efflux RND transporter periplasmic adaptor subunit [sulfur-oxidizing endosymbiont of Gigantopelta aegis]|uniref:efflux RND transporter periplasmic adaptor subunit n=1 Tax=sulfur-oxidizing endosymbiont of Gigantopelta aegis TaxID=2794934 RepID=UPI0018DE6DB6|nr:efflux RND transporter periplasmic adaptor subunit [sulfur-oxidizing endosymbiont of Gigantopelta aegis]
MFRRLSGILVLSLGLLAAGNTFSSEIIEVGAQRDLEQVFLGGSVIPYKEVTLSAQMPGRVEFLAGNEGDAFDTGALLVSISDESLLAKRKSAIAQYDQSVASLQNSQVQYNRELWSPQSENATQMPGMGMPGMFDQMFTKQIGDTMGYGDSDVQRQADLYNQGAAVNQAQSRVRSAREAINEINASIRDTRSIAPFKGMIIKKLVEVGDTVQPGMPLISYANTDYIRIRTEVPVRLVPFIKVGDTVRAYLDVSGMMIPAKVAQIYPLADKSKHTVTVKFDLPIGTHGVPGMYAEVAIPVKNSQPNTSITIPKTSILKHMGSLPSVLVMNDKNIAELHVIRLGKKINGGKSFTVLSGLKSGDRIVDHPPQNWKPGLEIK